MSALELLKFYQDCGVNEIVAESPFNRLLAETKIEKLNINSPINSAANIVTTEITEITRTEIFTAPVISNINPITDSTSVSQSTTQIISQTISQSVSQINSFTSQANSQNNSVLSGEIGVRKYNIIIENFGNMTQSEAIAKLIKKQQADIGGPKQALTSINEIVTQTRKLVAKINDLETLEKAVKDFEGCNLKKMATNTVFCDGDPKSEVMIIGEAPGNHEDLQGIPFCGDSGKLLNEMFATIGLPRDKFYITNTLFWRPPGNRRPTEDELALCRPFVEKHIALIRPKLIVLMGATAMTNLLKINEPISKVRGKFLEYNNEYLKHPIKTITLFHPSYLMRQPDKKRVAWQDLLTIDNFLNS
jgi:uracil-DNA glycosylase family 4